MGRGAAGLDSKGCATAGVDLLRGNSWATAYRKQLRSSPTHVCCCKGGCRGAGYSSSPRLLRAKGKAAGGGCCHGAGQGAAAGGDLAAARRGRLPRGRQRLPSRPRLQQ